MKLIIIVWSQIQKFLSHTRTGANSPAMIHQVNSSLSLLLPSLIWEYHQRLTHKDSPAIIYVCVVDFSTNLSTGWDEKINDSSIIKIMFCTVLHHILVSAVPLLISMTREREKTDHKTSNATTSVKSRISIHGSETSRNLLGIPANQFKPTVPIWFVELSITSKNCNRGTKKM